MKIKHRNATPAWFAAPESDPVDGDYEVQVRQSTERGDREYRQAQERLARAAKRLDGAQAQKATAANRRRMAQLREIVADRRAEVGRLARLMASPVTADKRIRLRTGLDDHLELGEHRPRAPRRVPPGPITTTYAPKGSDG